MGCEEERQLCHCVVGYSDQIGTLRMASICVCECVRVTVVHQLFFHSFKQN